MDRFETGISENNLKHWGEVEAVKEFVQNVVYAKSILGDTISITHDGEYAIIANKPSGFSKGSLLIGESQQSGVSGAPGEYGEGAKVAMSVLRRMGKECLVQTNGFTVKPELEPSSLDNTVNTLVFYIEDTEDNDGTSVKVQCSKETLDKAVGSFAVLTGVDEELTKKDTMLPSGISNSIYVNGVLVTTVESLRSYNFTKTELMNRDRTTVDLSKVKESVADLLAGIQSPTEAAYILSGIVERGKTLEAQTEIYGWRTHESVWKEAVPIAFGTSKVAIGTGGDSDTKARYHKFRVLTDVPTAWKGFLRSYLGIVLTSDLAEVQEVVKMTHRKPDGEDRDHLAWCKQMIKRFYADYGTVKVSAEVVDSYNNPANGVYDKNTDTIWIRKSVLGSKEDTFKVLLHETVHKVTGCDDNTEGFTKGWEDACWKILTRGKGE